MKPEHSNPSHPMHKFYNSEKDDYPESEAEIELRWKESKGVDARGLAWMTPRMERNAAKLIEIWDKQEADHQIRQGVVDSR